jgi:type IV secretory pathway VirB3-like protein
MVNRSRLPKDILFLAITRPNTKWGVPLEGFALNFVGCYLAYIWIARANIVSVRGVICILMGPVAHFLMRLAMSYDHNMFRILRLNAETRGFEYYGGSVLRAMPWRRPSKARDFPSHV